MERPETRYVKVGEADVAYQILGDQPLDLLFCYGLGTHVELVWDIPEMWRFAERIASFSRFILFDRRGAGASDRVAPDALATWEEWADDLGAVLDAAGSDRAVIVAALDAGSLAVPFAAMHPERVSALVLLNTGARYLEAPDYPIGLTHGAIDTFLDLIERSWGKPEFTTLINPSTATDAESLEFATRMIRAAATPRAAHSQYGYILKALDSRSLLSQVRVPTLVLSVRDNPVLPPTFGRYLAEHIEGATFVELPGAELGFYGDMPQLVADEVAKFVIGHRPHTAYDRVLTTVLFTDIVGSTEQLAAKGDHEWRTLLDTHDRTVRELLRRYNGREIKTTGDGFVASFDGPARGIRCAEAIAVAANRLGLSLRLGLHTGECELRGDDLGGMAVHIAARIMHEAGPGEILVSGIVRDLVSGSGIDLIDRGDHALKGVPDHWRLYAVTSVR